MAVITCEPREGGQRWTDGVLFYADNGTVTFHEGGCAVDLVEYIGPFPQPEQTVEINKLKTDWQTEFTAAQQLRSEVAQLERLLDEAREKLRYQEAASIAFDHHCEGIKAAYLTVIKTFVEMRS